MKKEQKSTFFQILTLAISLISLIIAFLAYVASVKANQTKVQVDFEIWDSPGPYRDISICYDSDHSKYQVHVKYFEQFIVTNNGGPDISLMTVILYEYYQSDFEGPKLMSNRYRLIGDDDPHFFPLIISSGTGQRFIIDASERYLFIDEAEDSLESQLQYRLPKELAWEFVFSDGTHVIKSSSGLDFHVPDSIPECSP